MFEGEMSRRPASLAESLAAQIKHHASSMTDGPYLDLLIEGGANYYRVGGSGETAVKERVASFRDWLSRMHSKASSNVALMDSTLVSTVHALAIGERQAGRNLVSAATLLDLATFARTVVLYDKLLVLPGATQMAEQLNLALQEQILVPLSVPVEARQDGALVGISAVFGNMFESAMAELDLALRAAPRTLLNRDFEAIASGWTTLLEQRVRARAVLRGSLNEGHSWASDGPRLVQRLVSIEGEVYTAGYHDTFEGWIRSPGSFLRWGIDRSEIESLVSECNHRSYFNFRVAHALGVPYVCSVTRVPFRAHIYQSAYFAHHELLLDQMIDRRHYLAPHPPELVLPVFGSIVLQRASTPENLPARMMELRDRSSALRRHRAEYERALHNGAGRVNDRLREAIASEVVSLSSGLAAPVAMSAAASLAAAASHTTDMTVGLIAALTMAGSLSSDRRDQIRRRLLRPVEWFLTSTSDTARAIGSSRHDIQRLWELDDEYCNWLGQRLKALSALGPA